MATVAQLMVLIGGNNSDLVKELNASKRQLSKFKNEMPNLIPDGSGKALIALAVGAGALGVQAIKMASSMEVNRLAFETMLGSGDKAKLMLSDLAVFAEKTPFEFDSLVNSAKKMLGLGIAADQVLPQLKVVGDAVAAVGGNSESVDSITNAFAKMQASGFISAEQMNRLTDAGIPGWQLLSKVLSEAAGKTVTVGEAMKMAEAKSINATTAISGMMTEMSTRYGGAMDKMSSTNTGIWSNIHDTAVGVLRDIGDQLNTSLEVKQYLNKILGELTTFKASVQAMGIKQALIDIIPSGATASSLGIMAGAITSTAIPALAGMAISIKSLGLAAGPVGLAIFAIGALTALVSYNGIEYEKTGGAARAYNNAVYDGIGRMSLAGDEAGTFAGKLGGVYSAAIEAARAMVIYNKATGDVAGGQKSHIPLESTEPPKPPPPWAPPAPKGHDLSGKADSMSDRIEKEWARATQTQLEQINIQEKQQLDELEEVAKWDKNYERDKMYIRETFAIKRQKILQEEAQEALQLQQKIKDGYADMQTSISQFGLTGSAKGYADIENESKSRIKAVADYYKGIQADYVGADDVKKAAILKNLEETGWKQKFTAQSGLDFAKEIAAQDVAIKKQTEDKKNEYHRTAAGIRADIDAAMQANNLSRLRNVLSAENTLMLSNYNGQQAAMKEFYDSWMAAHIGTTEQITNILSETRSSFKTLFTDILTGAESFGDAFGNFFNSIWKNIVNSFATQWAAGITNNIMSLVTGGNNQGNNNNNGGLFGTLGTAGIMSGMQGNGKNANVSADSVTNLTALFGKLGTTVQGSSSYLSAYNAIQSIINTTSKPAEATVTVSATTALAAFTTATVSATAALAAMASEQAASGLLGLFGFSSGGGVKGSGTSTSDSIPSMLSDGEYVIQAASVRRFGTGVFDALNAGKMPAFATGGLITTGPSLSSFSARLSSSVDSFSFDRAFANISKKLDIKSHSGNASDGDVNSSITVYGGINTEVDLEELNSTLGRTVKLASRRF